MSDLILIIFSAAPVNNIIVLEIIGADPALAFLRKMEIAVGLCFTMLVLLPAVTISTYLIGLWLLEPLQLEYLQLIIFGLVIILIVGCLKQWGHLIGKKLHQHINIFLPFAGINTTVLGVILLNRQLANDFFMSLAFGLGTALGFALVLLMLTASMDRLETADVPASFRGMPILLITLALMSMAFMGFADLAGN